MLGVCLRRWMGVYGAGLLVEERYVCNGNWSCWCKVEEVANVN